jgi:pimeloyl-ACP methyl ester carboxylesterase
MRFIIFKKSIFTKIELPFMPEHRFIHYQKSTVHYTKQGEAGRILLCFHGYGWNCYNFDTVMPDLVRHFTVYSFDLFAHGESEWKEDRELETDDLRNIFSRFLESENIERFSLMGYSMGGRWALSLLNLYPYRSEAIYLVAADGLMHGTVIDILSRIRQSNKIINYLIRHPKIIFNGIKMGHVAGFIDRETMNFYMEKNDTREKREQVMRRIVLCKNLFVPGKVLLDKIWSHHIHLHLFYGAHDYIMPPILTSRFTKALGKHILHTLDDDHLLIIKPPFRDALCSVLDK